MNKGLAIVFTAWLGFASALGAQPMYVIDQLFLGVHEQKGRESTILELLPSGTTVEVLQQDGKFVQVKTPGGTVGWVDGDYLVKEKPNKAALAKLEARYQQSQRELETARRQLENARNRPPPGMDENGRAELMRLRSENTELKETVASAEAQLSELAQSKVRVQPVKKVDSPLETPELAVRFLEAHWIWAVLGGLGVCLLLGFGFGVYLMDYLQRKRHGGFRV